MVTSTSQHGADIVGVTGYLRNQAPKVLIVCCFGKDMAEQVMLALNLPPVEDSELVEPTTRGDGETGKDKPRAAATRRAADKFQAQYTCCLYNELIVAGRCSSVKTVETKRNVISPARGSVAEKLSLGDANKSPPNTGN